MPLIGVRNSFRLDWFGVWESCLSPFLSPPPLLTPHPLFYFPFYLIYLLRKNKKGLFIDITDEENQQAYNIADTTPSAEDELITEQNLSQLLQFIKKLKPAYQEVIQLRYFQEMSYQEIAEQLGEPLSNVKIKLLRAKKLLA